MRTATISIGVGAGSPRPYRILRSFHSLNDNYARFSKGFSVIDEDAEFDIVAVVVGCVSTHLLSVNETNFIVYLLLNFPR
jgi:hypothetical protein